jgi:hypothetical protein
MMPGTWIAAVSARLLHPRTFDLVVQPALADLQFEAPRSGWQGRLRAYCGVFAACAGALACDLWADLHVLADDAAMLLRLTLVQAAYYFCMLSVVFADVKARDLIERVSSGSGPSIGVAFAAVFGLSAIPTLLCFWPRRHAIERAD